MLEALSLLHPFLAHESGQLAHEGTRLTVRVLLFYLEA